eukprot:3452265-Prymnesium_polylepis.1
MANCDANGGIQAGDTWLRVGMMADGPDLLEPAPPRLLQVEDGVPRERLATLLPGGECESLDIGRTAT